VPAATAITIPALGHAAPVTVGGEADWAHPVLGETWHGTVTGVRGGTAHVRWHSYTPPGGSRRKPMRHATRVPARALTPGTPRVIINPRRMAVKGLFDEALHPRAPDGEWTAGGEGGGRVSQTPSQFRHPSTGGAMGKTEIGDTFEALFRSRGAHLIEQRYAGPYVEVSGAHGGGSTGGRGPRNTPLDFRLNHRFGGELKTLNSQAANQKTAIKKAEVARKDAETARLGLAPLLIVQVVNMENRTAVVYAHPAFASKAVTRMEQVGSYTFSREDFRNAQIRSGHWSQRTARAMAVR
jgi:hypothetical protein